MAKRRKRPRPSSSPNKKRNKSQKMESDAVLCFQDVWKKHCSNNREEDETSYEEAVSNVFFELANAPSVSYRLKAPPSISTSQNAEDTDESTTQQNTPTTTKSQISAITIKQDVSGAAQTHTGGIVWETSYLLLNYLLSSTNWLSRNGERKTILEIGAGCGMLGLTLHKALELGIIGNEDDGNKAASRVIITETNEVMDNLRKNLERNYPSSSSDTSDSVIEKKSTKLHELSVEELDWTRCEEDCARAKIKSRSVDCIVGTDVVFSTRFVRPMLETMKFLSHSRTIVYLCLQERCRDSHELLLGEAIKYGFRIEDISEAVYNDLSLAHSCSFGRALECKLLKFTVVDTGNDDRSEKKKSRKLKKEKKMKKSSSKKNW